MLVVSVSFGSDSVVDWNGLKRVDSRLKLPESERTICNQFTSFRE